MEVNEADIDVMHAEIAADPVPDKGAIRVTLNVNDSSPSLVMISPPFLTPSDALAQVAITSPTSDAPAGEPVPSPTSDAPAGEPAISLEPMEKKSILKVNFREGQTIAEVSPFTTSAPVDPKYKLRKPTIRSSVYPFAVEKRFSSTSGARGINSGSDEFVTVHSFIMDETTTEMIAFGRGLHAMSQIPGDYSEELEHWTVPYNACNDETLRRWVESRAIFATSVTKKFKNVYEATATKKLIGTEGFDGLVFDGTLTVPSSLQDLLNKSADPNARDSPLGFTPGHAMAWSASLTCFPESWHLDRLRILRRAGADNRSAVDMYGRTALLLAMELSNVQFVKSILRVELGETWALHQLKDIPLFSPDGNLIKVSLHAQKIMNPGGGEAATRMGRPSLCKQKPRAVVDFKALLMQGATRPMFRQPATMLSGLHWAAFHDDPWAIEVLTHLGIPVNFAVYNKDPNMTIPLMIACVDGNIRAVEMLMRCNADPHLKNASGETAVDIAIAHAHGSDAVRVALSTAHPPFQQVLWGKQLGWDTPGVLAKLLERDLIPGVASLEDLCDWYQNLGVEPQDRVAEFWKFAIQLGMDEAFST
eukprot:GEMP01026192.1.p1 GENE.GEMP01026192.1~~GEMP01026192.1.p1  ORF type:complete len:590 (+),score=101.06 GEMP01026192.1:295-2064(+)